MASLTIGVHPAPARLERRRLLDALEELFDVVFEGRDADARGGLDAWIDFSNGTRPDELASLVFTRDEQPGHASHTGVVDFDRSALVDPRLRGQRLIEGGAVATVDEGGEPIARGAAGPVWDARTTDGRRADKASIAPLELEPGEALRNRIRSGRALGLLPLVEFLRRLTAARRWTPPPLRASFHFDDPNLHWRSYGHVSYAKLADHGRQHGYHAAMATVPLDAWLVYPTAARLFRERRAELSLLVHGNDHLPHELGRSMSVEAARAVAAEGLRRIARFELRSGVNVARVMAPPHGSCAESVVTGMLDVGFEAVCANMPRPWTWKAFGEHPFDAWHPGQLIGGGLPILLRRPFDDPPDDLVLRAYLDQPLIVYGHHGDLADGLRTLQDNAELINGIGDVKWGRLDEIARSNYASRRDNGRLELRMYSRHVRVPVEPEVAELCVQTPPGSDDSRLQLVVRAGGTTQTAALGETVSVDGPEVTVELRSQHHVDPGAVAAPPRSAWPVTRRAAAEARDRLQPLAAWPRQRTQRSA